MEGCSIQKQANTMLQKQAGHVPSKGLEDNAVLSSNVVSHLQVQSC